MSLFIRLQTNFWTHRKTMRLRSIIGEPALWIPPRLWSYAAENQPDGDFEKYTPGELAMLLGYSGDAQAMLEALQQASFMDGMKIHGWAEHNQYHERFAARAKKAAEARWKGQDRKRTRQERKGQDKTRASIGEAMLDECSSNACSIPEALQGKDFEDAWQRWAEYRKQARLKPYTEIGAKAQLSKLAEMGKAIAIAAIENSIANAYQGIFPPKQGQGPPVNSRQSQIPGEHENIMKNVPIWRHGK